MSNLPIGVRFCPTEEELITYYLKNKIMEQPMPTDRFMIVRDIYGESETLTPWILFRDDDPWQTPVVDPLGKIFVSQKVIYVFTKLSNVGKTADKNKKRVSGCGHWHVIKAQEPIMKNAGNGQLIGNKRTFTFQSEEETVGQWTMYEFELAGASLEGLNSDDNYVLCKIKRDDSKSSKGGRLVSRNNLRYIAIESSNQGAIEATKRKSVSKQRFGQRKSVSNKKLRRDSIQEIGNSNMSMVHEGGGIGTCGTQTHCPTLVNKELSASVDAAQGDVYIHSFNPEPVLGRDNYSNKQKKSNPDSLSTIDELFELVSWS